MRKQTTESLRLKPWTVIFSIKFFLKMADEISRYAQNVKTAWKSMIETTATWVQYYAADAISPMQMVRKLLKTVSYFLRSFKSRVEQPTTSIQTICANKHGSKGPALIWRIPLLEATSISSWKNTFTRTLQLCIQPPSSKRNVSGHENSALAPAAHWRKNPLKVAELTMKRSCHCNLPSDLWRLAPRLCCALWVGFRVRWSRYQHPGIEPWSTHRNSSRSAVSHAAVSGP